MITYAIDPGKHESSVAVGFDKALCAVVRCTAEDMSKLKPWCWPGQARTKHIILEVPRVYPKDVAKANDLIDEGIEGALIAGRIAERTGAPIVKVHPNSTTEAGRKGWKGQTCKPVHHQRILSALTVLELKIVECIKKDVVEYVNAAVERYTITRKVTGYRALVHNDLDAIGMFLEDCGRM